MVNIILPIGGPWSILADMRIEDLRGAHVGDIALWLGGDDLLPAAFHHHAQAANWHTVNALIRLAGGRVDAAVDERMGIVEWWRTVESIVALLTWTASVEHRRHPRAGEVPPALDGEVHSRWSGSVRWFADNEHSAPRWLTGLLVELRDFRNSFEHSSRASSRHRRHSKLAEVPAFANVADLMEALAICEATAQFVRFAIPGVDLMPQVFAPSRVHAIFEPLDTLTRDLLFPLYQDLVAARGLKTDVAPYDLERPLQSRSKVQAHMAIRASDEHDLPPTRSEVDVAAHLEGWVAHRPDLPPADQFRLPRYGSGVDG